MKTLLYKKLLTLSATALACAAVLTGNPIPDIPAGSNPNSGDIIEITEDGDSSGSEPGIAPQSDKEAFTEYQN